MKKGKNRGDEKVHVFVKQQKAEIEYDRNGQDGLCNLVPSDRTVVIPLDKPGREEVENDIHDHDKSVCALSPEIKEQAGEKKKKIAQDARLLHEVIKNYYRRQKKKKKYNGAEYH